jgi:hypothetical protein
MISNKYIIEKFFTAGKIKDKYTEIFINPQLSELKEVSDYARAFVIDDNFYVAKDSAYLFHYQIWDFLAPKLYIDADYFKVIRTQDNVISFQKKEENDFYLAESYESDIDSLNNLKYNIEYDEIMNKVKLKNPGVNFIDKFIDV